MSTEHATHGRGGESGPDDSDCPCRQTSSRFACAKSGCGFCSVRPEPALVQRVARLVEDLTYEPESQAVADALAWSLGQGEPPAIIRRVLDSVIAPPDGQDTLL